MLLILQQHLSEGSCSTISIASAIFLIGGEEGSLTLVFNAFCTNIPLSHHLGSDHTSSQKTASLSSFYPFSSSLSGFLVRTRLYRIVVSSYFFLRSLVLVRRVLTFLFNFERFSLFSYVVLRLTLFRTSTCFFVRGVLFLLKKEKYHKRKTRCVSFSLVCSEIRAPLGGRLFPH